MAKSTKKPRASTGRMKKERAVSPEILPPEEESRSARAKPSANLDREEEIVDLDGETADSHESPDDDALTEEIAEETDFSYPAVQDDGRELATQELGALSPSDPLRQYLREIQRYPLLSPEEERELAEKMIRDADIEAAKRLVQSNLRLVVKIAFEYRTIYSNVMDLIQEGNIGLMKAVSKFDPTKGARLSYYSSWWIRSYILKYLIDNFRLVKVGTTQAQKKLFYHLMREKQRLEAQGLTPAPKLLAERLDVSEKDVIEMEQRLSSQGAELSLEAPVQSTGTSTTSHKDMLPDEDLERADDSIARRELLELLSRKLTEFEKGLSDKERHVLYDRILAEEPRTLQEIADEYGLTRERVRQIEAKIVTKLREFMRPDLGI